jgi:hypothetical protein
MRFNAWKQRSINGDLVDQRRNKDRRSLKRWWSRFACLALVALGPISVDAAEPKRVLVLHSFGQNFAPWNEYARQIRAELVRQNDGPVDVYEATLSTARSADEDAEGPFAEYLRSLFANRRLDLVVTIGAPAARFFQKYRQHTVPAAPALFTAVEQRVVPRQSLTANDAVVALDIDLSGIIQHIVQLLPKTNHIAVVIGNSPTEKYWAGQLHNATRSYADRIEFMWFNELSFEEMLKRVAALPPRSAIGPFFWVCQALRGASS